MAFSVVDLMVCTRVGPMDSCGGLAIGFCAAFFCRCHARTLFGAWWRFRLRVRWVGGFSNIPRVFDKVGVCVFLALGRRAFRVRPLRWSALWSYWAATGGGSSLFRALISVT